MDHFQHPRNVGEIENASGVGTVGNAKCGDIMRIYLDIDEDGIIRDCKFKTFGCGAAVATSSMATEMVMGKSIQEALQVTNKAVMEALDGLPPVKVHCSLLAEEAIHAALWDYAEYHDPDGALYQIWLENEASIELKAKLVPEYQLAGIAAWKLGFERSSIWDVISTNM